MRDFSKWVSMWDDYDVHGISGGAVPGSAASVCWYIGFYLILFGFLLLTILVIVFPAVGVPDTKGIRSGAPHGLGVGIRVPSPAFPYATVIPATLTVRANHDDLESGRFGRMQERRSENA